MTSVEESTAEEMVANSFALARERSDAGFKTIDQCRISSTF